MTPNQQVETFLSCIEYITDCKQCQTLKSLNKRYALPPPPPKKKTVVYKFEDEEVVTHNK